MTIEAKIEFALADLEGLLGDGVNLEAALTEAADATQLRVDVLRQRAQRAWGDLADARLRFSRRSCLLKAVRRYQEAGLLLTSRPGDFSSWFEATFGHALSSSENALCERELEKRREDVQQRFHQGQLMALYRQSDEESQ